jgi:hypothetical protein
LADWIRATLVASADDPIALDGNTVRGARTDDHAAPHRLSFRTHQSQETLLQVAVSEKTNEIPVAHALLPCVPLAGRVCTADALHTHHEFMQRVDAFINAGGQTPVSQSADEALRRPLVTMRDTVFFQRARAQAVAQRASQAVSRGSEAALLPPGTSATLAHALDAQWATKPALCGQK